MMKLTHTYIHAVCCVTLRVGGNPRSGQTADTRIQHTAILMYLAYITRCVCVLANAGISDFTRG